jgi:hypothetical protein
MHVGGVAEIDHLRRVLPSLVRFYRIGDGRKARKQRNAR